MFFSIYFYKNGKSRENKINEIKIIFFERKRNKKRSINDGLYIFSGITKLIKREIFFMNME
jgi:hypothetical protein